MKEVRIAIRNLSRYWRYTIMNVFGLSVSISALIIIFQFLSFEFSFDRFYTNELCRVINARYQDGKMVQNSMVSYSAVGPALLSDLPEIINQTRIFPFGNAIVKSNHDQNAVNVARGVAVEPSFFTMFEYEVLAGVPASVLTKPNQLVLTETTATRIFNHQNWSDMIGTPVYLDNDREQYEVVGVIQDLPANTHFAYSLFMSYETIIHTWGLAEARFDWNMLDFRHYVQLRDGTDLNALNAKMEDFSNTYFDNNEDNLEAFELERIEHIYLSEKKLEYDVSVKGDPQLVNTLLGLALVLFAISWINFINLHRALLIERRKAIGIRRILGISGKGLWSSQSYEIGLVVIFAGLLGVGISMAATEVLQAQGFSVRSLRELTSMNALSYPLLGALLLMIATGTVLMIILSIRAVSTIRPDALLTNANSSKRAVEYSFQRVLLIFQFVLSIIAFTIGNVVYEQHQHLLAAPTGFKPEGLWVLHQPKLTPMDSTFIVKLDAFKQRLLSVPGITGVTNNQRTPGQQLQADYEAVLNNEKQTVRYLQIDQDYLGLYEIELLAGRDFQHSDLRTDLIVTRVALVNSQTLPPLGVTDPRDALGMRISIWGSLKEIIGVVDNYRQQSLLHDFQPTVLLPSVHSNHQMVIKTQQPPNQWLTEVEQSFLSSFPGNPFEYRNLEAEYFANYQSIADSNRAFGFFTLLSILVAMIGMVALGSLHLISRLKEISIRKVLGASDTSLFMLVLGSYLANIIIAAVLAAPFVYYCAMEWLNQFISRIVLSPIHFALPVFALGVVVALVLLLVTLRSIRINPIEILRKE